MRSCSIYRRQRVLPVPLVVFTCDALRVVVGVVLQHKQQVVTVFWIGRIKLHGPAVGGNGLTGLGAILESASQSAVHLGQIWMGTWLVNGPRRGKSCFIGGNRLVKISLKSKSVSQ